ncbi:MAG TPA: metalloendopeptidase [Bacteroidales bacterium]|nr:metalloendopeptidase [Bacteroidales bacterium]
MFQKKITFFLILILLLYGCEFHKDRKDKITNIIHKQEKLPEQKSELYKIPLDSFTIEQNTVKQGQSLSNILTKNGLSPKIIDKLVKVTDTLFNFKQIKAGNRYTLFFSQDTPRNIYAFVYEINPISYYRVIFNDSLQVSIGKKNIHRIKKHGKGIITTSLWNCVVDNNMPQEIALKMSEIYAWSIDFFDLKKGDAFYILYDILKTDSQIVSIEKIRAAVFMHNKVLYYAFLFDPINDYFDEQGNSLRKTFLKAPLRFSRISSRFSNSRFHPILKIYRPHHGIDYVVPKGTPVFALGDGKIIKMGYDRGGGKFIKIKHNSVYVTSYMHLWKFAKNIKTGKQVIQGELIGYVGATGLATGPHLDFRVYKNGRAINPLTLKSPPAEPIPDSLRGSFTLFKDSLKQILYNGIKKIYKDNI